MRLVLLGDVHGDTRVARRAVALANKEEALMIVNGDFMNQELKHPLANLKRLLRILSECEQEVYVIPGSHEDCKSYLQVSDHRFKKWDNIIDINKRVIDLGSYYLIGYGGSDLIADKVVNKSYFRINPAMDELMLDQLLSIKAKPVVFISHIPPYSYLDTAVFKEVDSKQVLPAERGEEGAVEKPVGSEVLKRLVEKHQPLLYLFGHIHESGGFIELKTRKKKRESPHLMVNGGFKSYWLIELSGGKARMIT